MEAVARGGIFYGCPSICLTHTWGGYYLAKFVLVFFPLHINTNDVLSQMRANQGFSRRVLTDQVSHLEQIPLNVD